MKTQVAPNSTLPTSEAASRRSYSKPKVIAARVGLCATTIRRWWKQGKIKGYKINPRVLLFDEEEVFRYVESAGLGVKLEANK